MFRYDYTHGILDRGHLLTLPFTTYIRLSLIFVVATTAVFASLVLAILLQRRSKGSANFEPLKLPGYSTLHTVSFFRKRQDFLEWAFQTIHKRAFQFRLGKVEYILGSVLGFADRCYIAPLVCCYLWGRGTARLLHFEEPR